MIKELLIYQAIFISQYEYKYIKQNYFKNSCDKYDGREGLQPVPQRAAPWVGWWEIITWWSGGCQKKRKEIREHFMYFHEVSKVRL